MKNIQHIMRLASLLIALLFSMSSCSTKASVNSDNTFYSPDKAAADMEVYARFEAELESIRQKSMVPGFSAAIVKDQQVTWAAGFGYADLEKQVEATPSTAYPLASLTKPFAAAIIMQLVEDGTLSLDDPITDYGVDFSSDGVIELRHVLSHTSHGMPGEEYRYNGDRFADLGYLVRNASGRSFRELLNARILEPLEMNNTAPNPISMGDDFLDVFRIWMDADNTRVYRATAKPYRLDQEYKLVKSGCPDFFTPAAGLISTVLDIAKFDIAMDQNILLEQETKVQMFTPTTSNNGSELPYGIGWFTQEYKDQPLIWHYGWQPSCGSSLILKIPDEEITFIVLANSDNLSRPYRLGSGEVLAIDSILALAFYKTFVFEPQYSLVVPQIDWEADESDLVAQLQEVENENVNEILQRELLSYRKLFHSVGRVDQAEKLRNVYEKVFMNNEARLENYAELLELGELPWIYLPLPRMRHVTILGFFVLIVLSVFTLWPIDYAIGRLRTRKSGLSRSVDKNKKAARNARAAAYLAVITCLVVVFLFVSYISRYPNGGLLEWKNGTMLVKTLIGFANLSVVFSFLLAGFTIQAWRKGYWSAGWRIHYTLTTIAILCNSYLWQQLDLLGWV